MPKRHFTCCENRLAAVGKDRPSHSARLPDFRPGALGIHIFLHPARPFFNAASAPLAMMNNKDIQIHQPDPEWAAPPGTGLMPRQTPRINRQLRKFRCGRFDASFT